MTRRRHLVGQGVIRSSDSSVSQRRTTPSRNGLLGLSLLALGLLAGYALQRQAQPAARTIEIRAVDGLQYDTVRFAVRPSQRVELTLINSSAMAHNLVVTEPGAREAVVEAALQLGAAAAGILGEGE